jgi:CheY-like chemotaxis protein
MTGRAADQRYSVALQGFSAFERGALASYFRLAARRVPAYVRVESLDRCDFVIADADDAPSLQAVRSADRVHDTVFVGAAAPPGALAWCPRPIDPMRIVRELDALLRHHHPAPNEPRAAIAPMAGPPPQDEADASFSLDGFDAGDASGPDVLVAEDSAVARRFLQLRLQQFGYRVHLAANGDEALALLAQQGFAMVFLDVLLGPPGSLDGLAICQQLKQDRRPGITAPKVVLVTGLGSSTDRVRGSLAGCDAYLAKPLSAEQLLHTLRTLDPGFAARDPSPAGPRPR